MNENLAGMAAIYHVLRKLANQIADFKIIYNLFWRVFDVSID